MERAVSLYHLRSWECGLLPAVKFSANNDHERDSRKCVRYERAHGGGVKGRWDGLMPDLSFGYGTTNIRRNVSLEAEARI